MATVDRTALDALAKTQDGLVQRRQLRDLGVTAEMLRWRVGRQWQLVLPGVVATFTGALTREQKLRAGQLWAGDDAVLTGSAAGAWHGLRSTPANLPLRFLVPYGKRDRTAAFVRAERTRRPEARPWERNGLRVVGRARAVVDGARELGTARAARAVLIEAVQRRLVPLERLSSEVHVGPRRGSRILHEALRDAASGAWSVPEADLLKGLARSRVLPEAIPNPGLVADDGTVLLSPDAWIDDVALALMVHSRQHHLREDDFETTVESDGLLGQYGVTVLGVTPRAIAYRLDEVVLRAERTYQHLVRLDRRPRVRAVPRHELPTSA